MPRTEAERVGLRLQAVPATSQEVVGELLRQIEEQNHELVALRLLPERVAQTARQVEDERLAREAAQTALHEERAAHRAFRERLAEAGWRERRRLLRELRTD